MSCKVKRTLFVSLTTLLIFFAIFPMLPVRPVNAESFNINISPSTGPIGTRVVVNGTLAHVGAQFRIFWQYIKDWDGRYGFLTSGYAEGYNYTATITIPPSKAGPHYIIVEDEKDHSTIATIFTVTPEITAEPSEGPAGTKVTVSGRLINNETIGIVFYNPASESGALVVEAQTDNNGYLVANFTVPQSSPGDYKIRAYWNNTLQSEVSFPFKLYPPPVVNVKPSAGLPGTRVTVTGSNFVPDSSVTVFFDDENPVATVITNGDGNFSTIFIVPEVLAGTYQIEAIDQKYEVMGETIFRVYAWPTIEPRSTEYLQGDTISFRISSTTDFEDGKAVTIAIKDPVGCPFSTLTIYSADLVNINGVWMAPYAKSIVSPALPSDAEKGSWTWVATYYLALRPREQKTINGTFQVIERPNLKMILDRLDELDAKIEGVLSKADDLYLLIETSKGDVLAKLDDLEAHLTDVVATAKGEVTAKIDTAIGIIELKLNQLNITIMDIRGSVVTIQTDLGVVKADLTTVSNIVSRLGANITAIKNGFAVIQTGMGEVKAKLEALDGNITSVENGIAAIETCLCEIKANLTTINAAFKSLNDTLATLQTEFGEVKVGIGELGVRMAEVEGLNATILTVLGKLQGTIESIEGNMAEILVPRLGRIEVSVSTAEEASKRAESAATGVSTILYATVAIALAASIISAFNLIYARRRASD